MTPQEKAIVQAAITWRLEIPGNRTRSTVALEQATWELITTCSRCNCGGHTCPGDGKSIGHGDTDCGEHDPDPDLPDNQMLEAMEQVELWADDPGAGPRWIPATFADCLAGDHIRIGTEETDVLRANRGIWHADARDEWRPKAWQHLEVRLELAAVGGFPVYPPAQAIEILMTPERHAVHTLAQAFPGSTVESEVVR